jgi:hypothetical protein
LVRRWLKIIAVNLLVFVALVLVGLAGLEVYLRASGALQADISLVSPFNRRLNPLFRGYYHGGYVTINKLGLRGPETTRQKPPGKVRIAFFGDSYTFGDEIDLEDTFPYLVQELLDRRAQGRFEVLNFGIPSYGTVREYWYLKQEGLGFEPDIVAVVYTLNDAFFDPEAKAGYAKRKPSLFRSLKDYLAARSYAFYYLRWKARILKARAYFRDLAKKEAERHPRVGLQEGPPRKKEAGALQPEGYDSLVLGSLASDEERSRFLACRKRGSPVAACLGRMGLSTAQGVWNAVLLHEEVNPGWAQVRRAIGLLQELAKKEGFRLFFVLYPPPPEDGPTIEGMRLIHRRLKEAIGPSTAVLDLLPIFVEKKVLWKGHPKRAPNIVAAGSIVALLESRGWLE